MPHQHHHDVDVLEPEVRYLPQPPARHGHQRRPSVTWAVISGFFRYVHAGVVLLVLVAVLAVGLLWAAFAVGGPAASKVGDHVSNWLDEHTTTTTTGP